jgi:hypothetical protein
MHYYDGEFPIGMLYNVETCEDKAAEMTATERLQEEEVEQRMSALLPHHLSMYIKS